MKALVYKKPFEIKWEEYIKPEIIDKDDIIVKIEGFTFSHADYRPYLGVDKVVKKNIITGHEGVGIIAEVGSNVSKLKIGDRVAIGCIIHCNKCSWCKKEIFANCENGGFILGTKINGTHSEYVRVPYGQNSVTKISKNLSVESAVMLSDILLTANENVIEKIDFSKINSIAIIGYGPIGLAVFLSLKKFNKTIDIYGHHKNKLNYFKTLKANNVFDSKNLKENKKYDLVIECVGNNKNTFELAQNLVDYNGTIILIGVFSKSIEFQIDKLWYKNITIKTGILNSNSLEMVAKKLENKDILSNKIVSKIYDKNNAVKAYLDQLKNKDNFKVLVKLI